MVSRREVSLFLHPLLHCLLPITRGQHNTDSPIGHSLALTTHPCPGSAHDPRADPHTGDTVETSTTVRVLGPSGMWPPYIWSRLFHVKLVTWLLMSGLFQVCKGFFLPTKNSSSPFLTKTEYKLNYCIFFFKSFCICTIYPGAATFSLSSCLKLGRGGRQRAKSDSRPSLWNFKYPIFLRCGFWISWSSKTEMPHNQSNGTTEAFLLFS